MLTGHKLSKNMDNFPPRLPCNKNRKGVAALLAIRKNAGIKRLYYLNFSSILLQL